MVPSRPLADLLLPSATLLLAALAVQALRSRRLRAAAPALLYLAALHLLTLVFLHTGTLLNNGIAPLTLLTFPSSLLPLLAQRLTTFATASGLWTGYLLLLYAAILNATLLTLLVLAFFPARVPRGTSR